MTTTFAPTVEDRVALTTAVNVWDMFYGELSGYALEAAGEIPGIFQDLNYMVGVVSTDVDEQGAMRSATNVIVDAAKRARAWMKEQGVEPVAVKEQPTWEALIAQRLEEYVDALNKSARDAGVHRDDYTTQVGRKYVKIVHDHSVHAFVDPKTGAVYKSAGWNAPATKHVRFWLADDASFADLMRYAADPHSFAGGYLYLDKS